MRCKDCEYLKIEKPDKFNEGHAYCTKYNLETMLLYGSWKRKVDNLECYAEQMKDKQNEK